MPLKRCADAYFNMLLLSGSPFHLAAQCDELLGEVLLVDDHSDLEELSLLPEHLERLRQGIGPDKVRLVRRETHDGIVAARNLGAKEARREPVEMMLLV